VHAVDWLFKFTQAQDWGEGARPIVWPSAAMQREALGLGLSQVKTLNRALIEAGLITMKDSPNGKRYGKRDGKGRIVEAYGFDLSPLAARQAQFVAIAAQGRADRERMRLLRRRATIARNGLGQILETVAELALMDPVWLRHDLGVSKSLWGEACVAMGREEAAIALAIVSSKPAAHFTSSAGGYFHGMVAKAKAGELNLARTVWGLRTGGKTREAASSRGVRDAGTGARP